MGEDVKLIEIIYLKIKFKILYKLNGDEPSREEVKWALYQYKHTSIIKSIMYKRACGLRLDDIAKAHCLTRERVRQIIRKGVRQSWLWTEFEGW